MNQTGARPWHASSNRGVVADRVDRHRRDAGSGQRAAFLQLTGEQLALLRPLRLDLAIRQTADEHHRQQRARKERDHTPQ
jgi:hypothetical protein